MLRNASLRLLRGGSYKLASQRLPVGCSGNALPLIREFCSALTEPLSGSKVNGDEFPGQDASSTPHLGATNKGLEKQGPNHLRRTKAKVPVPPLAARGTGENPVPSLYQIVMDTPGNCLETVMDRWIQEGNRLERDEFLLVLFHLRKQRMFGKALHFVEWISKGKLLSFEERDYACHLDLVALNHGIEAARKYIKRVPEPFRNEMLLETLLANCVQVDNIQKAEEVFEEIRKHSLTVSACNRMLILYNRIARTKVAGILVLMEKENIKPSPLTYKLLIDLKQQSNDTLGMEAVLDTMKADGIEPNFATQTLVAKCYISAGLTEKAEEAIRVMEAYNIDKQLAIRSLLELYAMLGRPNDVERIWKLCTDPNADDHLAAIEAWGKLGQIKQAEEVFEALLKLSTSSKYFTAMLNVYAENKLLAKGKEFLKRMYSAGCPIGPFTWDALVNLYVNSGEVVKADSFLLKVAEEYPDRIPLFRSHKALLKAYVEKGDIHNAEKIFDRLRKMRYPGKRLPYNLLLEAYVNAKFPAYGFRERMIADNLHPNKIMITQLNSLENLQKGGDPEVIE